MKYFKLLINSFYFDEKDIAWIKRLFCLKQCDMSFELVVLLQESIQFIDLKQEIFDDFLSGKKEYYSYLIQSGI
jgi:hypothetical protein